MPSWWRRFFAQPVERSGASVPSWNIHIAHVERLLREGGGADGLGLCDANEFLFGNFVPDVYVGYMVPKPTRIIDYKVTHLSAGGRIPLPRYDEFWDSYVRETGRVSDLVLGTWCHLVCDHVYNAHARAFLRSVGVPSSDETRIRKQDDFALFGKTLAISMKPEFTRGLVRACASFPQYAIGESDAFAAVEVARRIVDDNQRDFISGAPAYSLLTEEFFSRAREDANAICLSGLRSYAARLR
jgi:hypothetical protein